jgi:uncharacterized protein (DUF2336 family)
VREQLACRIAAEQLMPRRLILRLANDNIPVAHPVLEQSPVLTDTDLIEISRNRGQAQMLAISHRREISLRVSGVLAERGNEDVMHSLLQNPETKLPPETIDLLAGRSRACERIGATFVRRENVPREVLLDVLRHASQKVREDIRDRL